MCLYKRTHHQYTTLIWLSSKSAWKIMCIGSLDQSMVFPLVFLKAQILLFSFVLRIFVRHILWWGAMLVLDCFWCGVCVWFSIAFVLLNDIFNQNIYQKTYSWMFGGSNRWFFIAQTKWHLDVDLRGKHVAANALLCSLSVRLLLRKRFFFEFKWIPSSGVFGCIWLLLQQILVSGFVCQEHTAFWKVSVLNRAISEKLL